MKKLQNKKLRVVIIRSNPCNPDPRVEKEARAISEIASVKILAWDREGQSPKREKLPYAEIERLRLKAPYGSLLLFFLIPIWNLYIFLNLIFKKFDIVHACDFDTVIPSFLVAKIRGKKIVYDIFDFYADMSPLPSFVTKPISWIDKQIIKKVDTVILVDENRKSQIKPAMPKKLVFIYNTPDIDNKIAKSLRSKKIIKNYFFYGGSLNSDRMIKDIVEIFTQNKNLTLEIAGWGPLKEFVQKISKRNRNIKFLGKVTYDTVLEKTAQSQAVIAFYDPAIKNNQMASPNKFFEAIAIGKPIITNRNTLMAEYVKKYNLGYTVDFGDKKNTEKALTNISGSRLAEFKKNSLKIYEKKYNWSFMKKQLLDTYKELSNEKA